MQNPTALRHLSTRGNLESKAIAMGMDEEGMDVLMSLLSNMYSDGHLAVVREYSCNALDSHVKAGVNRPIEVTLPTILDPQLKIQDYGLGLSHDEMLNVYARYGASTKRNSNEQIGAFGIGAKSAFTVGNTFTVTAVKNGEKTIAMFALTREGKPTVTILHHGQTDEENGVLVDVGVENVDAVNRAAQRLFSHWRPGTVLVDGEMPTHIWDNVEELAKGVYLDWKLTNTGDIHAKFRLIMGGVPYQIPPALWNELSQEDQIFRNATINTKIGYIWDTPIGSVDIAPNREELRITPRTKSTVKRLLDITRTSLNGWMANKLDAAPTIWDAKNIYNDLVAKLNYSVDSTNVYWKGQVLGPSTITFNESEGVSTVVLERRGYSAIPGRNYRTQQSFVWYAPMKSDFRGVLFIANVPEKKKQLLKTYAKSVLLDRGRGETTIVGFEGSVLSKHWFGVGPKQASELEWIDFNEFWEHGKKLRKSNSGSSKIKTQYATRYYGDTNYRVTRTIDDMLDQDPSVVLYTEQSGYAFDLDNPVIKAAWETEDILIIFKTSQQSLDVLKRFFPEIESLRTYFFEKAKKAIENLSKEDHRIMAASANRGELNLAAFKFVQEHESKITNAEVVNRVKAFQASYKLTPADQARLLILEKLYSLAGSKMPYTDGTDTSLAFFQEKLPLLQVTLRNSWSASQMVGGTNKLNQALIDYINVTTI